MEDKFESAEILLRKARLDLRTAQFLLALDICDGRASPDQIYQFLGLPPGVGRRGFIQPADMMRMGLVRLIPGYISPFKRGVTLGQEYEFTDRGRQYLSRVKDALRTAGVTCTMG